MKSNVKEVVESGSDDFIASFSLPLLGGTKFTPKAGFKEMTLDQAKKLLGGNVPESSFYGYVNTKGYGVFTVSVKGTQVGTISFYPSSLDEDSSDDAIKKVTDELVARLKDTVITQEIASGADMMAEW